MPTLKNGNKAQKNAVPKKQGKGPGKKQSKRTPQRQEDMVVRKNFKKGKKARQPNSLFEKQNAQQMIPAVFSTSQIRTMHVKTNFVTSSFNVAIATLASFICQKGQMSNTVTTGVTLPWNQIYGGLAYLMVGAQQQIQGGVQGLTTLPLVIDNLIQALKPKEVNFHKYSKISYGWNPFGPVQQISPFPSGDGNWAPTFADPDIQTAFWNSPATLWAPVAGTESQYATLLKILGNIANTPGLAIVENGTSKKMSKDVSAYARNYSYNGLSVTPTAGMYRDIELEVEPRAPLYSSFCAYDTPDERAPRKLGVYSGGPSLSVGWPLHSSFTDEYNKCPIVYKQIDFEEIYAFCCSWMVRMKEAIQVNSSTSLPPAAGPFPFSQQSFRIALRQALVNLFDSQYFAQYDGYTRYNGNATNAFIPFLITGGTFGGQYFSKMMVPEIFAEILNALKPRKLEITNKKSEINLPTYVPIIGRYFQDTPATFVYNFGGVSTNLFADIPAEGVINLTDGFCGTELPPGYINLNNSFYQGVIADWNFHVGLLSGVSTETRTIGMDSGPSGLCTLYTTKIQAAEPVEDMLARPRTLNIIESTKYVKNSGASSVDVKTVDKEKRKSLPSKSVLAIPPASILTLSTLTYTCNRPLLQEEETFYNAIITPVIRLNDEEDALTAPMYQTETAEGLSTPYEDGAALNASGSYSTMMTLAGYCVTGLGKDDNNSFVQAFRELSKKGKAGMLAGLLGGFAKQFIPGIGPMVDAIAPMVPF
jgi:hypothetical protein